MAFKPGLMPEVLKDILRFEEYLRFFLQGNFKEYL